MLLHLGPVEKVIRQNNRMEKSTKPPAEASEPRMRFLTYGNYINIFRQSHERPGYHFTKALMRYLEIYNNFGS